MEIAHPGDLVVAAGISLFSHDTEHMVEVSKYNLSEQVRIGTRTDITTPLSASLTKTQLLIVTISEPG